MGSVKTPLLPAILLVLAQGFLLVSAFADTGSALPQPPPLPPELRQAPPTPPPNLPDPSELTAQLKQLGDLLAMPEEKLSKLRETIEFIEKMSPNEREAMRIRISQITQSTPELKAEIADMARRFPQLPRKDLSQFWHAASEAERNIVRTHLDKLPEAEQSGYLQAKIAAFVERREEVFRNMRMSLDKKRRRTSSPSP